MAKQFTEVREDGVRVTSERREAVFRVWAGRKSTYVYCSGYEGSIKERQDRAQLYADAYNAGYQHGKGY